MALKQLTSDFADPEYRYAYADSHLNSWIGTQLKVLREQRGWSQAELAKRAGIAWQSRVSHMENVDYESWSIRTLKRLARAFDLRLSVRFESFGTLFDEREAITRQNLERLSFDTELAAIAQKVTTKLVSSGAVASRPAKKTPSGSPFQGEIVIVENDTSPLIDGQEFETAA